MSRKQENKEEDKVIYTDPKTGKRALVRAEIVAKLNKVKAQLNLRKIEADVWYDLDKLSYEWEDTDGHYRSYNGENFIPVKDIPISVLPPNTGSHVKSAENPALKIELSDEYQHNHLQEAMDYALKEKGFIKADSGKLQWSLLPFEELKDVVRVLMLGAKKYTPDNWKKCDDVTRYKDALMRHVISYVNGDTTDDESGLSHLAHAVCNCLFLMYFDNTKKEA